MIIPSKGMRRRTFLASGTIPLITLAGCIGSDEDISDPEEETTEPGQVEVTWDRDVNEYRTALDIEIINNSDKTFDIVPIRARLGANGTGSFNLYNLEPDEKRTFTVILDPPDTEWVELIQSPGDSSDDTKGIPFQQSELSGKGDTLLKHVSENQFLLKAADHGVSNPVEVETNMPLSGYGATSILDNDDIQFDLAGPYWRLERNVNVISTSEEREISFFMETPDFSMTVIARCTVSKLAQTYHSEVTISLQ